MSNAWWKSKEHESEEIIFSKLQEDLYRARVRYDRELNRIRARYGLVQLPDCAYPLWKELKGRGSLGEFALVVARQYYRNQGYTVWASSSDKNGKDNFILVSYPGFRDKNEDTEISTVRSDGGYLHEGRGRELERTLR